MLTWESLPRKNETMEWNTGNAQGEVIHKRTQCWSISFFFSFVSFFFYLSVLTLTSEKIQRKKNKRLIRWLQQAETEFLYSVHNPVQIFRYSSTFPFSPLQCGLGVEFRTSQVLVDFPVFVESRDWLLEMTVHCLGTFSLRRKVPAWTGKLLSHCYQRQFLSKAAWWLLNEKQTKHLQSSYPAWKHKPQPRQNSSTPECQASCRRAFQSGSDCALHPLFLFFLKMLVNEPSRKDTEDKRPGHWVEKQCRLEKTESLFNSFFSWSQLPQVIFKRMFKAYS